MAFYVYYRYMYTSSCRDDTTSARRRYVERGNTGAVGGDNIFRSERKEPGWRPKHIISSVSSLSEMHSKVLSCPGTGLMVIIASPVCNPHLSFNEMCVAILPPDPRDSINLSNVIFTRSRESDQGELQSR